MHVLPDDLPPSEAEFLIGVAHERVRQIRVKGFSAHHDDRYPEGELSLAGAAYLAGPNPGALFYPWAGYVAQVLKLDVPVADPMMIGEFLTRDSRLEQIRTGLSLGLAEAGRRMRGGDCLPERSLTGPGGVR